MPQVFKIGSYWVYFWLDENLPLEPIHVHISQGKPVPNGTKVWITKNHRCSLAHNKSKIPPATLNNIIRIIEMRIPEIEQKWMSIFSKFSCSILPFLYTPDSLYFQTFCISKYYSLMKSFSKNCIKESCCSDESLLN